MSQELRHFQRSDTPFPAPLTKEKAIPALGISCRTSACVLQCKTPRVTHYVAVLLLGIHFHTKDPDYVKNTVNIFHFPDISLSAGSEAAMVTRIWNTALDSNTMTSYANSATRYPPHIQMGSSSKDVGAMAFCGHSTPRPARVPHGGV